MYYPKENKAGVLVEGGRELDDFKNYLLANSASYKTFVEGGAVHEEL